VWIGYPGQKKTLGKGEAGGVAALPMWISFMDKFMASKPNDKYPNPPDHMDKDVESRCGEMEAKVRKANEDAGGGGGGKAVTTTTDDTADDAKKAAKNNDEPKPETPRRVPKMQEPEPGERPRRVEDRPKPPPEPAREPEKKKRGKNG
jgi:penicillin-binding protein 1A